MTIKIDFEDEMLKPLIQQHLDGGPSVQTQVKRMIQFHNLCKGHVEAGKQIATGKDNGRGYFNDFKVLDL